MLSSEKQKISVGKNVEKEEPLVHCWQGSTLVQLLRKTFHEVWRILKKSKKHTPPYDPAALSLGIYPKEMKSLLAKRCPHSHVHCSMIHNSQRMEVIQVSTMDGRKKSEADLYTCTHTQGSIIHPQKENLGICDNMDGPHRPSH